MSSVLVAIAGVAVIVALGGYMLLSGKTDASARWYSDLLRRAFPHRDLPEGGDLLRFGAHTRIIGFCIIALVGLIWYGVSRL